MSKKPYVTRENGFFGFGHDYSVARGRDDDGKLVKGYGKTNPAARNDWNNRVYGRKK